MIKNNVKIVRFSPHHRCHNPPSRSTVPELTQINTLPRPQVQPSVRHRNHQAHPRQGRLPMRRHIIIPLARMLVKRLPFPNQPIENRRKVCLHIRVCVLINRQPRTTMLQKQMHHPHCWQLRQMLHHFPRHQMKTPPSRP